MRFQKSWGHWEIVLPFLRLMKTTKIDGDKYCKNGKMLLVIIGAIGKHLLRYIVRNGEFVSTPRFTGCVEKELYFLQRAFTMYLLE